MNRMGRSTLCAVRSTPLGIVATESGLKPARALLNHRQAKFAQRLYARPQGGGKPEEIPTREQSAPTTRLRAAAALRPGESVARQQWGASGTSQAEPPSRR